MAQSTDEQPRQGSRRSRTRRSSAASERSRSEADRGRSERPSSSRQFVSRSPAAPRSRTTAAGSMDWDQPGAKSRSRSAAQRGTPAADLDTEQPRKKKCCVVNLSYCKYKLLREVAADQGWEVVEADDPSGPFNLWWTDLSVNYQRVMRLRNWQRINHFPSMHLICRKNALSTTLGRLKKYRKDRGLPRDTTTFFPRTWSLKSERNLLRTQTIGGRVYIVKPSSGCQGKGIFLTHHPWRDTRELEDAVVQEYVDAPLLIEKKKFDLRVYALVTSVRHLSVHVFKEGLVRLCTEDYTAATPENLDVQRMHLTNYAINRQSENFVFNTDASQGGVGSKRDFNFFNAWLLEQGHSPELLWARVDEIIVKTLLAAQPQLKHEYNSCFPHGNEGFTCFEVLGFDLLVDDQLRPWLLEVNHTPSFRTDTPLDYRIKSNLVTETVNILHMRAGDSRSDARRSHEDFVLRTAQAARSSDSPPLASPATGPQRLDIVRPPGERLGIDLGGGFAWGAVTSVDPSGGGAAAGLAVGWRLVGVDGDRGVSEERLRRWLRNADDEGASVTLTFERAETKRLPVDTLDAVTAARLRRKLADEDRRAAPGAVGFRRAHPHPDPEVQAMYEEYANVAHEAAHQAGHVAAAARQRLEDEAPAAREREEKEDRVRSEPPRQRPRPVPRPRPAPRRHCDPAAEEEEKPVEQPPAPASPVQQHADIPPVPPGPPVTVRLRCTEKMGVSLFGGPTEAWRVVSAVTAGGAAERAGVKAGMRLLSAHGGPVASEEIFRGIMSQVRVMRNADVPFVFGDPAAVTATTVNCVRVNGTALASVRARLEVHPNCTDLVLKEASPLPLLLRPTPPPVLWPKISTD